MRAIWEESIKFYANKSTIIHLQHKMHIICFRLIPEALEFRSHEITITDSLLQIQCKT